MFDISMELSTKTIKRLYYYSVTVFLLKKRRISKITDPSLIVDNFIEISNISFIPRDLIDTHHIMTLIMKSST